MKENHYKKWTLLFLESQVCMCETHATKYKMFFSTRGALVLDVYPYLVTVWLISCIINMESKSGTERGY